MLWTTERFGARQAGVYRDTLLDALAALAGGPDVPGSRSREDLLPGLRSLHVARRRRRERHFILYRAAGDDTIEVIRILHESMDVSRHLPGHHPN